MDKFAISPFSTEFGEQVYKIAKKTVDEYGMYEHFSRGVLVGLSGGKDSVALIHFLLELRRRETYFNVVAVHINHMIRGEEADRDEQFSKFLANSLGVEFISLRIDVPMLAKQMSIGLEEAARRARYEAFGKIISERSDVASIAVAHNATDNLETVLFNMFRGAGANGVSGIRPVRDNIVRPLIDVDKDTILKLLDNCGVKYVTDSTNDETAYTRNFIRHNIVERIREISSNPEQAVSRMSRHLRLDNEYINSVADDFLNRHKTLCTSDLLKLHYAVFARVALKFAAESGSSLEETHILSIHKLLGAGDFSYSIPGALRFVCERGVCKILPETDDESDIFIPVSIGITTLNGFGADFNLYRAGLRKDSSNVYSNVIRADLSSAIIEGNLYFRSRKDGDTLFYAGHTHKLRKIFNDFKIPLSERKNVLLLCDERGIVWIPGLAVRDDGVAPNSDRLIAELLIKEQSSASVKQIRTVSEYRINVSRKENNR